MDEQKNTRNTKQVADTFNPFVMIKSIDWASFGKNKRAFQIKPTSVKKLDDDKVLTLIDDAVNLSLRESKAIERRLDDGVLYTSPNSHNQPSSSKNLDEVAQRSISEVQADILESQNSSDASVVSLGAKPKLGRRARAKMSKELKQTEELSLDAHESDKLDVSQVVKENLDSNADGSPEVEFSSNMEQKAADTLEPNVVDVEPLRVNARRDMEVIATDTPSHIAIDDFDEKGEGGINKGGLKNQPLIIGLVLLVISALIAFTFKSIVPVQINLNLITLFIFLVFSFIWVLSILVKSKGKHKRY